MSFSSQFQFSVKTFLVFSTHHHQLKVFRVFSKYEFIGDTDGYLKKNQRISNIKASS